MITIRRYYLRESYRYLGYLGDIRLISQKCEGTQDAQLTPLGFVTSILVKAKIGKFRKRIEDKDLNAKQAFLGKNRYEREVEYV
ncbi:MAG: hypothetical protein ISS70_07390 [Phycisphaerae bacterium]|nr:hypothetical protein [Phycisphaerae bacterium]